MAVAARLPYIYAAGAAADVPAIRNDGRQIALKRSAVSDLRARLRGDLLQPGEAGYDQARRIWNGSFDRKPALIARCAGAADVIQAVTFARAHDLVVAVRGGGHSLSGQSVCEGGLMIDLARMRSIHVDPHARTARQLPGVGCAEGQVRPDQLVSQECECGAQRVLRASPRLNRAGAQLQANCPAGCYMLYAYSI